jgi:hypothetical protein
LYHDRRGYAGLAANAIIKKEFHAACRRAT